MSYFTCVMMIKEREIEASQHQVVIRSNARVQIVKILAIPQCTTSLWQNNHVNKIHSHSKNAK